MAATLIFRSVSRTHAGLVRPSNEDALLALDGRKLWAVSDGMGGHSGGAIASKAVVDRLAALSAEDNRPSLEQRARAGLAAVNLELCDRNDTANPPTNMGATIALLGMEGARYFCLWAGDSRVYQLRGGKLKRLTRDHRLVQELIDAGALNDAAASHHPQRNLLTRAVGTDRDLEFECCKGEVEAGDRFILVTDGVSGICSDEEIFAKTQSQDMNAAADALLELCLQRRAPDNLALILVAATNSI